MTGDSIDVVPEHALLAEYEALKIRLAREHPDDPAAYTAGKRAFVASALARSGVAPGRR